MKCNQPPCLELTETREFQFMGSKRSVEERNRKRKTCLVQLSALPIQPRADAGTPYTTQHSPHSYMNSCVSYLDRAPPVLLQAESAKGMQLERKLSAFPIEARARPKQSSPTKNMDSCVPILRVRRIREFAFSIRIH